MNRSSLKRVKEVVDKVRHIQQEADRKGKGSAKYLTDRCNAIAKEEHKRLNVIVDHKTGELLSKPVCSYRYYTHLMESYRNGIKALGFKHHAIDRHVNAFIRKHGPEKEDLKKKLDPLLPIEKLRDNLIILRADTVTGSDFRRDLLSLRIEHHAYYMFEPKGSIKDWRRDDDKKQLKKKLNDQILVNPEWVKNLASDLLTKNEPSTSDLCIGIALATGRRLTEIIKTAAFKPVDDMSLLFSGQLKTKNRHLFEELSPYEIPSMVNAEIVAKALKILRRRTGKDLLKYKNTLGEEVESRVKDGDKKDYLHNHAVMKKYEGTMNGAVRSVFQNGNFSLKDCRALYTEITYEEHAKKGESRSAYRHRVLGHSLIETQLHYEVFKLDTSIDQIELVSKENDKEDRKTTDSSQQSLVDYLKQFDNEITNYSRAPKIAVMHKWLKQEVENGLELEKIKASYIRRFCLIGGKQLNLNVIKGYLGEETGTAYTYKGPSIRINEYEPPREKPKDKKSKAIFELEERIKESQRRVKGIVDDRAELDKDIESLRERMYEIEYEIEELEDEEKKLTDEIKELKAQLKTLKPTTESA